MRSRVAQSPRWFSPAAAVLSGLLFALAFPPLEWVLLLPLALVPWIVALAAEESRSRALVSGFLFGLAHWCVSIPWIVYVVKQYGSQTPAMGIVCLLLLAAILAEWPAVVAWGVVACGPAGSTRRIVVFPLLWMASEHARSFVYGGFPWNLTGHALYRHPIWLQTAAVWGVYGVGALVVTVSCLLAAAVGRKFHPVLCAAVLVFAVGAFGVARLAVPQRENDRANAPFPVAILQPNVSQETRLAGGDAQAYRAVMNQARAAAAEKPLLIVIPESAFPVTWDRSEFLRRDLMGVAGRSGGGVIFNDIEELPDGRYYNVARLLGSNGLVGGPYRKVHLVPFGEYVPLPKLFFFVRQVSREIGEFSAAPAPTTLGGDAAQIGVGVCYEILYPGLIRDEVGGLGFLGANLLVTISNDSWYGRAGAQEQHFAGAVLRSVETKRYLLRAAITGISGIVDEKGRIRGELGRDRAGIVRGT
ncbi:MAG: apolipoprotein N-acyltransferase, partial [Thermoanaerobaculia bacterium]